jgi:hypothetical protein
MCGGPVKPAWTAITGCWLGPDACAHTDGEDYATLDETARWIVTSSDELLGDESTNTPFEVALVETEDSGAVAQVLSAPDLDASWLAYEMVHDIPHIPDWEAISEGEAWYRSLEMEPDALLEAINAAVVFAAGLFVVSTAAWPGGCGHGRHPTLSRQDRCNFRQHLIMLADVNDAGGHGATARAGVHACNRLAKRLTSPCAIAMSSELTSTSCCARRGCCSGAG